MSNGMIVDFVKKGSIADEVNIKKGDIILSINNEIPKDIIEYSFLVQNETLELRISKKNHELEIIEIEKDFEEDLGICFKDAVFDKIKPCCNKCIFCFVEGQPKGLRESLYIKDDDWRLSYLQGTYITMTNIDDKDWARIASFRPSPLYVSIHTTNPKLRVKMLKNKNAGKILENLKKLDKLNIEIEGQIVLCPEINDGKELIRTLNDLKEIKSLKNLAIVPVGLSKYRNDNLKSVDKKIALETIDISEKFNRDTKRNLVNLSDEFFILAGREIPNKNYYGDFLQIEDGVGTIRLLSDDFEKCKKKLKKELKTPVKLTILTGSTGAEIFKNIKKQIDIKNLDFEILEIKNDFFGEKINVAGLITGCDIIKNIKNKKIEHLLIPSVMFREKTEEFLDGKTLSDIKKVTNAKIHVIKNCFEFKEILKIINSF